MSRATPEQIAEARALYDAGDVPISTIEDRTGLTRRQVGYACKDLPAPKNPRERDCVDVTSVVVALVVDLGYLPTALQVGEQLGVTRQRAHALMQRCRIPRARPGRRVIDPALDATIKRDETIILLHRLRLTAPDVAARVGCSVATARRVLRSAGLS